jgi:drug/metabolite transporter (DMT)-like permease
MSTANNKSGSYLWITATLIAASMEPIIAKMGYAVHCTPLQLLCLKSIVGALVIWPLTRQSCWVGVDGLKRILPVALLLLSTSTLCLCSLQYIKASLLITIVTVTPAAVALANQALGRDLLGAKFWMGFALCATGLSLTAGAEFGQVHVLGIVLAFLAVASSTTYRVLLEKLTSTYKPAVVSTYIFLINGLCLLPILPFIGPSLPPQIVLSGLWLGVAAAVANVAFLYAISILGSTRVSIMTMLERPIIITLAALVLKEALSPWQIAGIILVIVGVQLAKVTRKVQSNSAQVAHVLLEPNKAEAARHEKKSQEHASQEHQHVLPLIHLAEPQTELLGAYIGAATRADESSSADTQSKR